MPECIVMSRVKICCDLRDNGGNVVFACFYIGHQNSVHVCEALGTLRSFTSFFSSFIIFQFSRLTTYESVLVNQVFTSYNFRLHRLWLRFVMEETQF